MRKMRNKRIIITERVVDNAGDFEPVRALTMHAKNAKQRWLLEKLNC